MLFLFFHSSPIPTGSMFYSSTLLLLFYLHFLFFHSSSVLFSHIFILPFFFDSFFIFFVIYKNDMVFIFFIFKLLVMFSCSSRFPTLCFIFWFIFWTSFCFFLFIFNFLCYKICYMDDALVDNEVVYIYALLYVPLEWNMVHKFKNNIKY